MSFRKGRLAAWWTTGALLGSLLANGTARANGAFPSSGQILIDPTDPTRVGVRATYGLVETADGGASFRWTCETVLGYSGNEHPQLGITGEMSSLSGWGVWDGRL